VPRPSRIVVTCEHGGYRVPRRYAGLFDGALSTLSSHRGWDPGALRFARRLARQLGAPLHASETTRLLVEANRSRRHRALFSEFTRHLPEDEKQRILERHWAPYREGVADDLARGPFPVLHLSIHSFTPVLDGVERTADFALLYDPARPFERAVVDAWLADVHARLPELRVRRNYPYRGTADGLTTTLRKRFPAPDYAGIEVELNQALATDRNATAPLLDACVEFLAGART